ncbi:MAG: peptidoglycan DD-metalloendopeptidase family protein [Solirubrobacterales bacterium]
MGTVAATLSVGAGAAAAGGGGVDSPGAPELADVTCIETCAGLREATAGSRVQLSGRNLETVDAVKFAGGGGRITVAPIKVASGTVDAKVPDGAVTGTVRVADPYGNQAETSQKLVIVDASQIPDGGDFKLNAATAKPRKTFFDGRRRPKVTYLFEGGAPTDVRIEVVSKETRAVVATLVDSAAQPNTQNTVRWNGKAAGGTLAPNGKYKFRVGNAAGGVAQTTARARFGFYSHRFPVIGRHSYGDGFGAGRNHQGQDVFARCGRKVVAARGGTVQFNKTHSAAGNYLVIDGKATGTDYMYAHLQSRSPLQRGSRVRTGQVIGRVGDTGNASGCHLHFEVWSAPGWYQGGRALRSVRRLLKTWDSWS